MSQLAVVEGPFELRRAPTVTSQPRIESTSDRQSTLARLTATATGQEDADAQRILRAAWSVLERSHFRSLKIRQVLTASNTSASTFYRLFPSKSHLLLALLEDETARGDRMLAERIAEADSAQAGLQAWLVFHIRTVYQRNRAERARLFLDPGLLEELPDDVRRLHDVTGRRLVEVLRRGMAERVFRPGDPVADAAMVRHLVRGLLADGLTGQLGMSEQQAVDTTFDFVLRALRPVSGTREELSLRALP